MIMFDCGFIVGVKMVPVVLVTIMGHRVPFRCHGTVETLLLRSGRPVLLIVRVIMVRMRRSIILTRTVFLFIFIRSIRINTFRVNTFTWTRRRLMLVVTVISWSTNRRTWVLLVKIVIPMRPRSTLRLSSRTRQPLPLRSTVVLRWSCRTRRLFPGPVIFGSGRKWGKNYSPFSSWVQIAVRRRFTRRILNLCFPLMITILTARSGRCRHPLKMKLILSGLPVSLMSCFMPRTVPTIIPPMASRGWQISIRRVLRLSFILKPFRV